MSMKSSGSIIRLSSWKLANCHESTFLRVLLLVECFRRLNFILLPTSWGPGFSSTTSGGMRNSLLSVLLDTDTQRRSRSILFGLSFSCSIWFISLDLNAFAADAWLNLLIWIVWWCWWDLSLGRLLFVFSTGGIIWVIYRFNSSLFLVVEIFDLLSELNSIIYSLRLIH